MKKVTFIILHYLSDEMTVQCVDNLLKKYDRERINVIIVDNASPNGSGKRLKERYQKDKNCVVLLNSENIGFARGNNVGYLYAKEQCPADFFVIMNNDVIIEQVDFLDIIENIYDETGYWVLGPDILSHKTYIHQNPMKSKGYTLQEVEKIIRDRKRWLAIYPLHYFKIYVKYILKECCNRYLHIKKKNMHQCNILATEKRIWNPVLHGACYIFSEKFIRAEKEAFNPNTFLYFEEDILHLYCQRKQYCMLYDSSLKVTHMEDVSTNMAFKSNYKKRKMKYRNLVKSATVMRDLMMEKVELE